MSLQSICISEMVSRAAKHLFKTYMQSVETMFLSSAIAHFLNCFLGSYASPTAHISKEEVSVHFLGVIFLVFLRT